VLLVLTGSSCSGKSTALVGAIGQPLLAVHDFDEVGAPAGADVVWRQRTLETWVRRALSYQSVGMDVLLAAQSPLGEVLAVPSTSVLNGIGVCLLDVEDRERVRRLERRDPGMWDRDRVRAFLGWARWHRAHAADPQARPDVIRSGGWDRMQWRRWSDWRAGDPRWRVEVIDTTASPPQQTSVQVSAWVQRIRTPKHVTRTGFSPAGSQRRSSPSRAT
jgi:hypothetical protein